MGAVAWGLRRRRRGRAFRACERINRSNNYSFGGVVSGNGALQQLGTGTTTLTNTNTYSGGTTINAGTLVLSGSGTLGHTANTLTVSGGTLDLGTTPQTQNGGLTLSDGTILNGTLSSTGTFSLQAGTVSAVLAGSYAGFWVTRLIRRRGEPAFQ